jgi:hypothetical protein
VCGGHTLGELRVSLDISTRGTRCSIALLVRGVSTEADLLLSDEPLLPVRLGDIDTL